MDVTSHMDPFQNSRLFVSILNPNVPGLTLFGLPAVFHVGILGLPTSVNMPSPISVNIGEFLNLIGSLNNLKLESVVKDLANIVDETIVVVPPDVPPEDVLDVPPNNDELVEKLRILARPKRAFVVWIIENPCALYISVV